MRRLSLQRCVEQFSQLFAENVRRGFLPVFHHVVDYPRLFARSPPHARRSNITIRAKHAAIANSGDCTVYTLPTQVASATTREECELACRRFRITSKALACARISRIQPALNLGGNTGNKRDIENPVARKILNRINRIIKHFAPR